MSNTLLRVQQGCTYAGHADLTGMVCPTCGIVYAIPTTMVESAYAKGNRKIVWHCPNGHELGYNGESKEAKAKRTAEREAEYAKNRAARLAADLEQTRAHLHGQKSLATRMKNERNVARERAAAALCPCCNRSFKQLRRHMASKHPNYEARP